MRVIKHNYAGALGMNWTTVLMVYREDIHAIGYELDGRGSVTSTEVAGVYS